MVRGEFRRRQHQQEVVHESCWEWLDSISLLEVYGRRVPVLQSCHHHIRGRFRQAVRQALELSSHAVRIQDRTSEEVVLSVACDASAQGKWCSQSVQAGVVPQIRSVC